MQIIGDTIKRLRLKKGLTQKQLATLMKVSGAKICTIERSSIPITTKTLLKFAAALKVSPGQLMYEDWNTYTPSATTILVKELNEKITELDQQIYELRQKTIELYDELHVKRNQFPKPGL